MEVFISLLMGMGPNVTWDALKYLLSNRDENSLERQFVQAIKSTMKEFYEIKRFEYDENIVMEQFLESFYEHRYNLKYELRNVVEYVVDQSLKDDDFVKWVDIYKRKFPIAEYVFTDREQLLTRMDLKVDTKVQKNYGEWDKIIDRIITLFDSSWKENVLSILRKFHFDLSYAEKDENNDLLIKYFNKLNIEWERLDEREKKNLHEYLEHPHFNRVQIVSGISGSGKTHFVERYISRTMEKGGGIPCYVCMRNADQLYTDIMKTLSRFMEVEYDSLNEYALLLNALNVKIVFIIENINVALDNDWSVVVDQIKEITRFENFKFLITINEYEYYQIEKEVEFLYRYCIETEGQSCFSNCLSIDAENIKQNVVGDILKNEYGTDVVPVLATPQEAIYYGECVQDEVNPAPPSSYYEYIKKITLWKESQVGKFCISGLLDEIVYQKNSVVKTELDVEPLRHAQLLTYEGESYSIFNTMPSYHLRIFPYWAAKIVSHNSDNLFDYTEELREWLISCYIFYRYENEVEQDNLNEFFINIKNKGLLDNAVFCAYRSDLNFIRGIKNFLLRIDIDQPRLCYAVLRFITQCNLKVVEKFKLCVVISEKIVEYGLIDFYGRVVDNILATTQNVSKLRKNMLQFVQCDVDDINHVTGYKIGNRYMELIKYNNIKDLIWVIVQYIEQNELENRISSGNNKSFLDHFLRKCFEYYIVDNVDNKKFSLRKMYDELEGLFNYNPPIGPYLKRNLTCAAGNVFENRTDVKYHDEYIELVHCYISEDEFRKRLTAWFLIKNSVGAFRRGLDEELIDDLKEIMLDKTIMDGRIGEEIKEFVNMQL